MSRLTTHLNKPKDDCLTIGIELSHLRCGLLNTDFLASCDDCVGYIHPEGKGTLNHVINQLETNHERTDQESN